MPALLTYPFLIPTLPIGVAPALRAFRCRYPLDVTDEENHGEDDCGDDDVEHRGL